MRPKRLSILGVGLLGGSIGGLLVINLVITFAYSSSISVGGHIGGLIGGILTGLVLSGFGRGHLCPRSDRAADKDMSSATFVMSNVVPQAPRLNQKAWAAHETYLRGLVRKVSKRPLGGADGGGSVDVSNDPDRDPVRGVLLFPEPANVG